MEAQLRELYRLTTVPDDNTIRMATEQLVALYSKPETIFPLIILMNPNEPIALRKAATIGLKNTLQRCWEVIRNSAHLQGLKDSMIQLLSNEQDYTMRHILLDAMLPIFSTETENWPQLLQYIQSLANAADEASIELFLSIFTTILRYLPINFVAPLFENLLLKAKTALSTQSIPVILAGSNLLRAILTLVSTEKAIITSVVMDMLNAFYILMKNNSPIAGEILNDICAIFLENENFFDTVLPLLQQYYTIVSDNNIPIERRIICTEFLCTLIKKYPEEIEPQSSQIIAITLGLASLIVVDDCFDSQLDLIYAVRPIEQLSRRTSPDDFFASFWSSVQIDTPNKLAATAAAINLFIENIPDIISMNFSDIFDFAIGCIQSPIHFVQEGGFSLIFQLVSRHYLLFSDLFERLMQVILPILQNSTHEPLICRILSTLSELLFLIEVPDNFIEPLLGIFAVLIQKISPINRYLVISAISSLIYSSQESIKQQQATPNLIPILQQAVSHDPTQGPLIVASGLEALSYLISYSPAETAPIHQFTLEKIHFFLQFEDPYLFTSVMHSLRVLSTTQELDFISNVNPQILFASMVKFLQFDVETIGTQETVYSSILEAKEKSLLLIASLARAKPQLVAPFITSVAHLVINHFNSARDEYSQLEAALKATIGIAGILSSSPDQSSFRAYVTKLIDILVGNFESRSPQTVSLSFYGFSRLLASRLQLEPNMVKLVVNAAFIALKGSLNCQQEDEDGDAHMSIELSNEVFGFLAVLATNFPSLFPLDDFFNHTQKNFEKWRKGQLEVEKTAMLIECVGVLCEIFAVSAQSFPSIFRVELRKWFFESLKICKDFEYPPHPLAAVRCYVEVSAQVNQEELNAIVLTAQTVFSSEFQGQTYYSSTMASLVSLLFSTVRIVTSLNNSQNAVVFNIDQFLPKMLQLLPRNLVQAEAENVIVSIVWCARNISGFVQAYGSEVLRILALVLAMKRKRMKKLKLSDNAIAQAIQLLNEIRAAVPQSDALIASWLDKFSIARFKERIAVAPAQQQQQQQQ